MAAARTPGPAAVIAGLGSCLPAREVDNEEVSRGLDTSDAWIRERTGIHTRRFAAPGVSTLDLGAEAARLALKAAGGEPVDLVVLGSTTPEWVNCPATAPAVAHRLGLANVGAFDVSAACSSFLYAAAAAAGMISTGAVRSALVIGAETLSTIRDPDDRNTAALLADGAGAVVLRAGDPEQPGALGPAVLGSDGEGAEMLVVPAGGARQRSAGTEVGPHDTFLHMRGRDTYRHAVERMTAASRTAAELAGWELAQVDRFAAHQANARICDSVGDKLGIAADRRLANIDRVGNTGAASIPVLLAQAVAEGGLLPGHRTLLAAFGSGLTWAATSVVWPDVTVLAENAF